MQYSEQDLRSLIKNEHLRAKKSFEILRQISSLSNKEESIDVARELLIRLLDYRHEFDSAVLNSLLRKVGLYPYMDKNSSRDLGFSDSLAYELHKPSEGDFVFHSLQSKVFNKLINGENVVLSAPTSFGKSIVVDSLIATGQFKRVLVILPTLALIDESRQRITQKFGSKAKVITHSSQKESSEEGSINIYVLTQERTLEFLDMQAIDLFIVDEFYKVDPKFEGEDERAIILNYAFHHFVKRTRQFYLLGPNIQQVNGLEYYGKEFFFISSSFTTVAADVVNHGYKKNDPARDRKLKELVFMDEQSKIIYCQSPNSASQVAEMLANSGSFSINDYVQSAISWVEKNYSPHWRVADALKSGLGLHHGGIPRFLQQWMIWAFNNGFLKALICTSTIIEGVNTVAKMVILYDRRKSNNVLDFFSFKNIVGRAGRMGEHFVGEAHILESPPDAVDFDVSFPLSKPEKYNRPSWYLLYEEDDERPPIPQGKINDLLNNEFLSQEVLKENLPLKIESQIKVAKDFKQNSDFYSAFLFNSVYPDYAAKELLFSVCFTHFLAHSCMSYGITTHPVLLNRVESLLRADSLASFLSERIERNTALTPSEVVESNLRFIRNVVCFSLPRSINAIIKIANTVIEVDFDASPIEYYAVQIENLGIEPAFFTLEEFGLPFQIGKELSKQYKKEHREKDPTLEEAMEFAKSRNSLRQNPSIFERTLFARFEDTVI